MKCDVTDSYGGIFMGLAPPPHRGQKIVAIFNVKKLCSKLKIFENVHLKCTAAYTLIGF